MEEFMLPCLNKQFFGMDCLGCGAQRAFFLLVNGEFSAAWKMYPAIYSLVFLLAFLFVNLFYKFKYDSTVKLGLILLNAVIIVVAYAYRMRFLIE